MRTCLVTGGAGFIGSHLVEALVLHGHRVRVLDDFSTGARANLQGVGPRIEIVSGDILDSDVVRRVMQGVDVVFHTAARTSVPRSVDDPLATHRACATGTLNVLLAARDAGVRRVVYTACASAYGNSRVTPRVEHLPVAPISPYAIAKLSGEYYCEMFYHVYGLETVRLRCFNVYGPRQPWGTLYTAVIPRFLEALYHRRQPLLFGDGSQSRDFTYVDDVVQAHLLASEAPRVAGLVYNVGFGRSWTMLKVLALLNELMGTHIEPICCAARPGDIRHSMADISKAQTELGYSPYVDLPEGLARCLEYYLAHYDEVAGAPNHNGAPLDSSVPSA